MEDIWGDTEKSSLVLGWPQRLHQPGAGHAVERGMAPAVPSDLYSKTGGVRGQAVLEGLVWLVQQCSMFGEPISNPLDCTWRSFGQSATRWTLT
ncbi:unnamed protein product [Boreogadus saida]